MNTRKIISIVLVLVMVLGMMPITFAASIEGTTVPGSVLFFDNFDKKETWSAGSSNLNLNIESDEEHKSYMKMIANDGASIVRRPFDELPLGKSVIEFDLKADNETSGANKYIYFTDGANGASIMRLFFGMNGTLQALSGKKQVTIGEFIPDVWHKIKLEVDITEKKYEVFVDGESKGVLDFAVDSIKPSVNYITVRADANTGYLSIDNLVIYQLDGKPATVPTPKIPTKYEVIQRFPTPTPVPTQTPQAKTGKEIVYFEEDFETWPEWVTNEKDKANDDEHGNYLGMTEYTRYYVDLDKPIREGENITVEFDFRFDTNGVNANRSLRIRGNNTVVMSYHFGRNGNVNSDYVTTARIHNGGKNGFEKQWHHLKAVFNSYKKEYTVYVDDQYIYTVAQYEPKKQMEMKTISIDLNNNNGTFDLDNLKVYDPDGTVQPDEMWPILRPSASALEHKFSDMIGNPDKKGSVHYTGHSAENFVLILNALGLINGYEDGTYKPDNNITRAEFAAIVARAFKLADKKVTTEFNDVPADHWASGNIGAAYAAGIINGYGDGRFGPNDPIKEEQAVKMVVAALGYNDDATAKGGYPFGYIQVGNEKYISRGLNVHTGENATRGLVAQIMFYALGVEMKAQGKTLYSLHADKAGKSIGETYINAMLQDYYYYREEALEIMLFAGISPIQVFNSMLNVFKNSEDKEERTRAARVLSEFVTFDRKEYDVDKADKAYMELLLGKMNMIAAGDLAMVANNPAEDEDVRLYAIRALYLLDRDDLVEKTTWTLAFKTKAMEVTRHLTNKAQDILEMTNDEESTNALIAALSDSDVEVVLRAVSTLYRKGINPVLNQKAQAAIPALQKLLNHPNAYVPYRAYEAIIALGGTPDKKPELKLNPYGTSNQDVKTIIDGIEYKPGDPIPDNKVVVVNNGNIEITFDASDGQSWAGFKKITTADSNKGLLLGYGFITWNQSFSNGLKEHDGARTRGLKRANEDFVEYFYKYAASELFPYTLEIIYRIPRGESGYYTYLTVDKVAGSPACNHGFAALMQRMDNQYWTYAALHDKLQLNKAFSTKSEHVDTEYGIKDIYQSVYRNQTGELDAKHEFNPYQLESSIDGHANSRLGWWNINASVDSMCKLLKNDSNMMEGEYFTWDARPVPAGEYHKIYGPIFSYFNKGDTFVEMWEDAKNKQIVEKEKWPYAWIEDDHYFERGSVSGKVEMWDGTSAEGAYVVINQPGETTFKKDERVVTWMQSNSPYQYWTRADKNGNWSIENVHADTYTVTVWKEGYPGEVAKENVVVESNLATDVGTITFKEYSNGKLAWRMGDADRTWLYDEEKNFDWDRVNFYRNRFPNNVEFKIGESVPKYDWNYAQIKMDDIRAEGDNVPFSIIWDEDGTNTGTPILTIATCSSRNTKLSVFLNGTKIKELDYSGDDSMVMRTHGYGKLIFNTLELDKSLMVKGENKITLEIAGGEMSYDFIQLEYKE